MFLNIHIIINTINGNKKQTRNIATDGYFNKFRPQTCRNSKQTGQSLINHKFKTNKENPLTADNHIIIIRYTRRESNVGPATLITQIYASLVLQKTKTLLRAFRKRYPINFVWKLSILLT